MLGFAAPAAADTYKGTTSQDETMRLTVNKAGVPVEASYGWDMTCRGGGSLSNGGTVSSNFPRANARGFESSGRYTAEVERKFEAEVRVRIEGERVNDTRFTGTFKLKAKVSRERSGEIVARCSTGIVRWTADLKEPVAVPDAPATPRFRR